ncbi:MAG: ATP-binding cassette domain-containing protein [Bryobacteraceae bacterium]|nr:ATP-binding cassette domain-containing protein [Bryobacteraceae bacterium]
MLTVAGLTKTYPGASHAALRDVSFALSAGECAAVVGRSGAGKSTLARCLAGFERPSAGSIAIDGRVQLLFQDSPLSLNPRWSVERLLAEPFVIARRRDATDQARALAERAGFPKSYLEKPIWALSGGERQLVALSRTLSVDALALLIMDEPFTGLDERRRQRIAGQVEARRRGGLSLLLITHDLHWARQWADRVLVLDEGRLVDDSPVDRFFAAPRHPAGAALLAAQLEPVC